MTFLATVAFRATKIPTTLRAHGSVTMRATRNLEDTMLPVNYLIWRGSFSELPKSCQQWKSTFQLTVAFRSTKILTTVEIDIPGDHSFQRYQNPDNFKSWWSVTLRATKSLEDTMLPVNSLSWQGSFPELLKSCQRWELTFFLTVAFKATKISASLRVNIPVASRAT